MRHFREHRKAHYFTVFHHKDLCFIEMALKLKNKNKK